MRILQSLSLIVALAICYLLFFQSQSVPGTGRDKPEKTTEPGAQPQTQYKADLDQARTVANQMKRSRQEQDSF